MKIEAIIPCAGTGMRMNNRQPKPLIDLCGKPLFCYAVEAFARVEAVAKIILAVHPDEMVNMQAIIDGQGLASKVNITEGGSTRRDSVARGLALTEEDTDIVIVHDAARPLIAPALIVSIIEAARTKKAVVAAVPATSTIKSVVDGKVERTLKRSELWEAQTPQAFDRALLKRAHAAAISDEATDDAMMVEQLGEDVFVYASTPQNIKVTTDEDLIVAASFLKKEHHAN